jgi:subtilisin family serine protease
VDIFAPGVNITSSWNTSDTATNTISGTSMASPHVAGAAALVLSANPSMSPAQVRNTLVNNATTGVVRSAGTNSPNRLLFVS